MAHYFAAFGVSLENTAHIPLERGPTESVFILDFLSEMNDLHIISLYNGHIFSGHTQHANMD